MRHCYRLKNFKALPSEHLFSSGIKRVDGNVGRNGRLQEPRGAPLIGGDMGAPGKKNQVYPQGQSGDIFKFLYLYDYIVGRHTD
jgi:hypothetical protein